ncbi:hypothetical protein EII20_02450 [Comamonadaceae bacterium OH2545_COT-014]|nr:hypothetical protein EII20_02450 [Comamonadaceae bacterium OH2545_COT-014]
MPAFKPTSSLSSLLLIGLLAASPALLAQTPSPASPAASGAVPDAGRDTPLHDRKTQRVEHIRVEDAGSRVDELRTGGETRRITVQPKAGVPAYSVQPAGSGAPREAGPGAAGQRTWKVLDF